MLNRVSQADIDRAESIVQQWEEDHQMPLSSSQLKRAFARGLDEYDREKAIKLLELATVS